MSIWENLCECIALPFGNEMLWLLFRFLYRALLRISWLYRGKRAVGHSCLFFCLPDQPDAQVLPQSLHRQGLPSELPLGFGLGFDVEHPVLQVGPHRLLVLQIFETPLSLGFLLPHPAPLWISASQPCRDSLPRLILAL